MILSLKIEEAMLAYDKKVEKVIKFAGEEGFQQGVDKGHKYENNIL